MKFQEEKGRFFLNDENGKMIAEVTFQENEVWNLDHTYVSDTLRGQGIAAKLVDAVVQKARKEGKKIYPTCPYAVAQFDKLPEYSDVRAESL